MFRNNARGLAAWGALASLLAGCSGGGSTGSTPAVSVESQSLARQAASNLTVSGPMPSMYGLPPSFHGFRTASRQRIKSWLSPTATLVNARINVSDATIGAVFIYDATTLAIVGGIDAGVDQPLGSFVDSADNLYVANVASSTVTVYAPNSTVPNKTYSKGLSAPVSVAVSSSGTLFVAENGPGQVVEYDKGSMSPSRTIAIPFAEGVALDSKSNLYVSYNDPNSGLGQVQKFAPKSITGTNLGISVEYAGDLKLDRHDNLILEDQSARSIAFYAPGTTTAFGTIATGAEAYKLAINKEQCRLYVATFSTTAPIFLYKDNGAQVQTIENLTQTTGVSITPTSSV